MHLKENSFPKMKRCEPTVDREFLRTSKVSELCNQVVMEMKRRKESRASL